MSHPALAAAQQMLAWIDPTHSISTTSAPPGATGVNPLRMVAGWRKTKLTTEHWRYKLDRYRNEGDISFPLPLLKPELILPSARIAATRPSAWPSLPAGPRQTRQLAQLGQLSEVSYHYHGRDRTGSDFMRDRATDAVVVIHDGTLVHEEYQHGHDATTLTQAWSVTKALVSTLVGNAVHLGLIASVDDPIEHYLPATAGSAWEGVTLRQLMQMESGVHWNEHASSPRRNAQMRQWGLTIAHYLSQGNRGMSRNEYLLSLKREAPAGTRFRYNSGNTQVLAWMLEELHQASFAQVLSTQLWSPLGAEADATILTDAEGNALASMGVFARPRDLARLGQLFLDEGVTSDGERIVSAEWVHQATTFTAHSQHQYGFHWWENGPELDGYCASGFLGQTVSVAPRERVVGVRIAHDFALPPTGNDGSLESPADMGRGEFQALLAAAATLLDTRDSGTGIS